MLFKTMEGNYLATIFGIVLLAFAIRGLTGFGSGLILTPLLSLIMDVKQVVTVATVLHLVGGLYLVLATQQNIDIKKLLSAGIPSIIFCIIGSLFLSASDSKILLALLGISTVAYATYMLVQPEVKLQAHKRSSSLINILLGLVSGFLHGLYGTGGPPIVILFSNQIYRKETLRATLIAYFFILDAIRGVVYFLISYIKSTEPLFSGYELQLGILMLLPTILGVALGNLLQRYFSEFLFRRIIAIVLLLAGLAIVVKL